MWKIKYTKQKQKELCIICSKMGIDNSFLQECLFTKIKNIVEFQSVHQWPDSLDGKSLDCIFGSSKTDFIARFDRTLTEVLPKRGHWSAV